jgi:hypothetical protein
MLVVKVPAEEIRALGDNFLPPIFPGLSITAWSNSESPDSIIGPTIGY